jgi:hypothetical protein
MLNEMHDNRRGTSPLFKAWQLQTSSAPSIRA